MYNCLVQSCPGKSEQLEKQLFTTHRSSSHPVITGRPLHGLDLPIGIGFGCQELLGEFNTEATVEILQTEAAPEPALSAHVQHLKGTELAGF